MFRFEHIDHLYALLGLPILILLFVSMWYARKRAIQQFGNSQVMQRLMPQLSKYKHAVKFTFLLLALVALTVAWANPQWGTKREKVKRKSVDVFIALDISQSMLAQDIRPNRMERARKFAQKLIEGLKGERIGTIIFAGNAYLQMPLTTDYSAALMFIKSANPKMAPSQGTAIGEAINLAEQSFEEDNKHHKALVLISDGENHQQESLDRATEAHENGLLIFTVGVGTPEGGYIPAGIQGRNDYKRDQQGNLVRSYLNETMLSDLAQQGGGSYFNLEQGDQIIEALKTQIDQVEKREFEQRVFDEYESYFQYFAALGLLFIIIEFLISYRTSRWMEGKDIF